MDQASGGYAWVGWAIAMRGPHRLFTGTAAGVGRPMRLPLRQFAGYRSRTPAALASISLTSLDARVSGFFALVMMWNITLL